MRDRDLWLVAALAAAGLAVQFAPVPALLRAGFGLPLVLFCPGYALVAAVFPGRVLAPLERALLSVGLSLGVAILSAIVLNGSPWGLQTVPWASLFLLVTLAASLIAARRRTEPSPEPTRLPQLRWAQIALLSLAGLLTVGAITLARLPQPTTNVLGYTVLWMTPDDAPRVTSVHLGVSSSELTVTGYRLQVSLDSRTVLYQDVFQLAPGQSWAELLELPPGNATGDLEAVLYRTDQLNVVYRRVLFRRVSSD